MAIGSDGLKPAMDSRHHLYPRPEATVFLAVVLDAYSRRVIGWELGRTLYAGLATKVLKMALNDRIWQPGVLIHHSDRGVRYASRDYTSLLVEHEIRVSMSGGETHTKMLERETYKRQRLRNY
jgi:transposase InsO family protein